MSTTDTHTQHAHVHAEVPTPSQGTVQKFVWSVPHDEPELETDAEVFLAQRHDHAPVNWPVLAVLLMSAVAAAGTSRY